MVKKLLFVIMILTLVILPVFSACKTETSSTTASTTLTQPTVTTSKATTVSTQANWWDKFGEPQYGGTLVSRVASSAVAFDPLNYQGGGIWFETLFQLDWKLDRDIFSFTTDFCPAGYHTGALVDSWEQTDPVTITVHIRPGVHWQNKSPVNGRELTAEDVAFSFDRQLGLGHGYTTPNPWWGMMTPAFKKVTVIDANTVAFTYKNPGFSNFFNLTQLVSMNSVVAKEWVALGGPLPTATVAPPTSETSGGPPGGGPPPGGPPPGGPPGGGAPVEIPSGPLEDWHTAVGTGAWMLTDFVSGGYQTLTKNPDYWGYDERHPDNKIPYADTFKQLVIPDDSTAIAALRTGKIDIVTGQKGFGWQAAETVKKSDPDILSWAIPSSGISLDFRNDMAPFTDIRVRNAFQMAVDREAIAKSHYGGAVDTTPVGQISKAFTGYALPYDQWPQDVKDTFVYNPQKSKELLAEAGFPDGFKTDVIAPSTGDTALLQILKAQFLDIGVDMTITVMDTAAFMAYGQAGKHSGMAYSDMEEGSTTVPWVALQFVSGLFPNFAFNRDATYDAMCQKFATAIDETEMKKMCQEAELYVLQHNYEVRVLPQNTFYFSQPYLKGYNGEFVASSYYARFWIDQSMKTSMGY